MRITHRSECDFLSHEPVKVAALHTTDAMIERIQKAFENMPLPVIIEDQFNCVPDYSTKYAEHIDPDFGGFSYSEHDSGYHVGCFKHNAEASMKVDVSIKKHHSDEITLLDTSRAGNNEVRSSFVLLFSFSPPI